VLRQSILEGEFLPGQRLLSDPLAAEFKISRTPCGKRFASSKREG
jgi:DNA-binding GntR family transcriptional regulator